MVDDNAARARLAGCGEGAVIEPGAVIIEPVAVWLGGT
jgi:hypothetical protein